MDLSAFLDSLRRGFGEVPPVAIALVLLAGPTIAMIGYRLLSASRRMQSSQAVVANPLWVCHDCRSVNELRATQCYRCGLERDEAEEVEIVVDQPAIRPRPTEVPAGSPFAAVAGASQPGPGVPVMAVLESPVQPVAVGPGRTSEPVAAQLDSRSVAPVEAQQ